MNMAWGNNNKKQGASRIVKGDLKSERGFRVDGRIEGTVESASAIVIGESGVVTGDVRGTDVIVVGCVDGNIHASGHLDIRATGKVIGDVTASSVRIETGGVFRGTSRMGQPSHEDDAHLLGAATSLA
jgi:cytoskeletal protein CcmA (bactofilin family)